MTRFVLQIQRFYIQFFEKYLTIHYFFTKHTNYSPNNFVWTVEKIIIHLNWYTDIWILFFIWIFTDSTSVSSNSNHSRATTTPGPSSVSSSGFPASPSVINLDSPSPTRSPQPTTQVNQPASCMVAAAQAATEQQNAAAPFSSPNSMPFLNLGSESDWHIYY